MQAISESEEARGGGRCDRKLLVAVDDSSECEKAVAWAIKNVFRDDDELHLIHVIPKLQLNPLYGAPPVDFLPQQDPVASEQLVRNAEQFISDRFSSKLTRFRCEPIVHIVKSEVDTDSIGNAVCRKASDLNVAAVVISSQSTSKLQEFFLGSVTNYCTHHSKRPVLVVRP